MIIKESFLTLQKYSTHLMLKHQLHTMKEQKKLLLNLRKYFFGYTL